MVDSSVEELMKRMGKPGKFQLLVFAYLCVNMATIIPIHLRMVFYAAKTRYHCRLTQGQDVQGFVPVVTKNEKQWDGCRVKVANITTETIPCTNGWTYYLDDGEATIISEFNLVCKDAYKADLATTIYFCGVTLSGLPFGYLSDRYGRKPIFGLTLLASGIIGIAMFIFRTYTMFAILMFCSGFIAQGLQNCCFVLATELFSTKYRGNAGLIIGVFGFVGAALFGLCAFVVKDWKYIQLCLSLPSFVLLFGLCVIPESVRWHLLRGNFAKAEAVIKRTVSFNNLPFPREVFDEIKQSYTKETSSSNPQSQRKANVLDMFRSPLLRKISLILVVVWFTVAFSYYALTLNISFLFGNKYLNFVVGAISDICFLSVMTWVSSRFGRRRPLVVVFFLAALANVICAIIAVLPTGSRSVKVFSTASALFGKSGSACALCTMFLFTAELYPTVVRNVSIGVNTFWCRTGGIVAPQILFLAMYTSRAVPYSAAGGMTLLSGFLILLLPETHGVGMTERLKHTELETDICGQRGAQGAQGDSAV